MAALLGAVLVVALWAGWSALGPKASPSSADVLATAATVPVSAPPAVRADAAAVGVPAAALPLAPPQPQARALPVVPDGFTREHGQLTALRAPMATTAAPIAPVAVTLPPGVRPEDAVVSPTGMVALTRAAAPTEAAPNPPRPVTSTQSR